VAKTIDRLRLIDGVASVTLQSSTATPNATSGSAATGQCPAGDPAYQIAVTFQPLPSSTEIASAAKSTTVAKTGSGVAR